MDWTGNSWWGKTEPDLRSLYEWLDTQAQYSSSPRSAICGAIIGTSWGLCGASIGVLAGAFHIHPIISVAIPITVAAAATITAVVWSVRGRTQADKALARTNAEMRGFLWKMISARWQGNIKGILGEPSALELNQAAFEYLKCRNALRSPSWLAAGSDSAWSEVREKTRVAMEVAMARIVTLVGQGAPSGDATVAQLLEDMRQTSAEAERTANRLAGHRGLPTDASRELRTALSEMKSLNAADQEFQELTLER